MFKKGYIILLLFLLPGLYAHAQENPVDSLKKIPDPVLADSRLALLDTSELDYELLFNELEHFLDSIASPRSYFMSTLGVGRGYFNFLNKTGFTVNAENKLTYTPLAGYYNKSGLGITATGSVVNDDVNLNLYQFALTPSYDYLKNKKIATGLSYTRFFTKDSLPFYTTPIQNELYAYFTMRKWWFRPMVALSYGWGSRTDYEDREELITSLRLRPRGYTRINTTESVSDFSLITSVRHDFYWLDVLAFDDYVRVTPQFVLTSGTQKFGFNQSSNTYAYTRATGANVLYSSESTYLDDQLYFQPLSLSFLLRTEYSLKKFFIQPQLMLDYYFPAADKNFTALFSLNLGLVF